MILNGKVAFVTGGSRGIGAEICLALSNAGAEVVLTYQAQKSAADSVIETIKKKSPDSFAIKMDVRDRQSVRRAMLECTDRYGQMDILVNNAGINKPTDFDKVTDDDWDEILAVNLKGPFICSQEALPLISKSGGGSIINIGSVSGQYGGPRTAHYAASKAGLISLGQVIARYGAKHNIRCNTVAAGLIASEMATAGLQAASVQKAAENVLLGRLGSASDVASAVMFLASDSASYVTGQTINVNGGLYF